jgi:hypothetical protein
LRTIAWVPAQGNALAQATLVHQVNGVAHQAVVAAVVIAYHGLYAGIANVLQLLVIRAIHIGFNSIHTGRAPANIQHLLHFGVVGFKFGVHYKRVAGGGAVQVGYG